MNPLLLAACVATVAGSAIGAELASRLVFADGDRALMVYNAGHVPSPDADAPWYGRSGFIHPVRTPAGRVVTAGFPAAHRHQHGIMFAWTTAVVEGHEIDFWNSAKQQGRVEHVETVSATADRIEVRLRHVDETVKPAVAVLDETWAITRVPHGTMNVFDLVSTQSCSAGRAVLMKKYHYGALCVRGPEAWLGEASMMETSAGLGRVEGNHSRPDWVALSGRIDGALCGLAAMSHPENFRAPQPVRLHPGKPYFCFAPMITGDFTVEPGKPFVSRFRFAAFDGELKRDDLRRLWKNFSSAGR